MEDYLKERHKAALEKSGDPFWRDNYGVLTDKPSEILPDTSKSANERFNAYTRFLILVILGLAAASKNFYVLLLIPVVMVIISILYDMVTRESYDEKNIAPLSIRAKYDIRVVEGIKCRAPTENNPFMTPNYLVDPPEVLALPACSSVSRSALAEGRRIYDERTPYDVDNAVSGTDESARNFLALYTIGSWPPERELHAKWLHGVAHPDRESCREHSGASPKYKYHCEPCLRNAV